MAVLRYGVVTPRGIVLTRPLRLMSSPFAREGAALQTVQPWTDRPDLLSPAQIARTKALADAARGARGTFGVVFNPNTGRMMPAIAGKVAATISGKLSPTERLSRSRAAAAAAAARKRTGAPYLAWKAMAGA